MGYPVSYRNPAFSGFPNAPPISRGPGQVIPFQPRPSGLPVAQFGGGAAAETGIGFGRRQAARAAGAAAARAVGSAVLGRVVARAIPYVGAALTAYDIWQWWRKRAVWPKVDMTLFGYTLCPGSCPGPVAGTTIQAVCPPLVGCATPQALNPGMGASGRPTIFGTFQNIPGTIFQTRVDTWTRPAVDPFPNGYRARWSGPYVNVPASNPTSAPNFPSVAGTSGFSVDSPGLPLGPQVYIPPVSITPSPTPFVWGAPGSGPHPGDIPSDYPSHIPPPRWLVPSFPDLPHWPQWRESGNNPPRSDPRPASPPGIELVGSINTNGGTNVAKAASPAGRKPPPNPKAKERKLNAPGPVALALARALSAYTEISDAIDNLYDALPAKLRRLLRKTGQAKNPYLRAQAVYKYIDQIDWTKAMVNVITNEQQDRAYSQAYGLRKAGTVDHQREHRKASYGAGTPLTPQLHF